MARKFVVSKVSGSAGAPDEKFIFFDAETNKPEGTAGSVEDLWQFFVELVRAKYDREISRAREKYDRDRARESDLQLADSEFDLNPHAKPKI